MNSNDPIKVAMVAPITVAVALLAVGCSFASFAGRDVSALILEPGSLPTHPWRALTTTILHGSAPHLVFNLMWMWGLGVRLETAWGSARTLAVYILFGAGAALAEYALSNAAIGLSGVVYGLCGLLYFAQRSNPLLAGAVSPLTVKTFVAWFFLCILLTWTGAMNVANTAHGVGAVLGVLLGLAVAAPSPRRRVLSLAGLAAAVAALVAASVVVPDHWRPAGAPAQGEKRAFDLFFAERYAEAADALAPIVRADPANARASLALGYALLKLDRVAEGIDALRAGVLAADEPIRAEFALMLGQALAARAAELETAGDLPAALDAFHEAARWNPEIEERFAMLGAWCAEGAGDPHEAARLYRIAARNPATRAPASDALERLGLAEAPEGP